MLIDWYLQKQFRQLSPTLGRVKSSEVLKHLARLNRLVCTSLHLFQGEAPFVSSYFAIQDQTYATKQKVLQIAGSLAMGNPNPLFQAIVKAAEEATLPMREVEVDVLSEMGVTGRLERTWYILGDEAVMQAELIDLGVTSRALMQQLELSGLQIIFLAQRQPKRLLGIFAFDKPLLEGAKEAVSKIQQLGVELVILTDEKARVAKGVASRLGVTLLQCDLQPEEKIQIITALNERAQGTAFLCSPTSLSLLQGNELAILVSPRLSSEVAVSIPALADLPGLIQTAQQLLRKAKHQFFWTKV